MESFDAEKQRDREINDLLQEIKYLADNNDTAFLCNSRNKRIRNKHSHEQYKIKVNRLNELKEMGAIDFTYPACEELNSDLNELKKSKNDFIFIEGYSIKIIEPRFSQLCKKYKEATEDLVNKDPKTDKSNLQSIQLVTRSLEPSDVIFLVLDRNFHLAIRCAVKNTKGEPTYIKKLYDIAYLADAPGKRVDYNKRLADNINNGLFRKRPIAKYMRTNKFQKPTLVQKSEDKKRVVLKNEIHIETLLIKNIPTQLQYLYKDKTM